MGCNEVAACCKEAAVGRKVEVAAVARCQGSLGQTKLVNKNWSSTRKVASNVLFIGTFLFACLLLGCPARDFMGTFNSKFYITLYVVSVVDTSFFKHNF